MTSLDGPVLLLLMLAAVGAGMALLVAFPYAPLLLIGGLLVSMQASVYVCGAERGFLSDTYVGKVMVEYERMRALRDPRPNWTPWEDG